MDYDGYKNNHATKLKRVVIIKTQMMPREKNTEHPEAARAVLWLQRQRGNHVPLSLLYHEKLGEWYDAASPEDYHFIGHPPHAPHVKQVADEDDEPADEGFEQATRRENLVGRIQTAILAHARGDVEQADDEADDEGEGEGEGGEGEGGGGGGGGLAWIAAPTEKVWSDEDDQNLALLADVLHQIEIATHGIRRDDVLDAQRFRDQARTYYDMARACPFV